jgi:predicted  nucleic acid-binding Zn-ribbon protein
MITPNDRLSIQLRNRGNDDVEALFAEIDRLRADLAALEQDMEDAEYKRLQEIEELQRAVRSAENERDEAYEDLRAARYG